MSFAAVPAVLIALGGGEVGWIWSLDQQRGHLGILSHIGEFIVSRSATLKACKRSNVDTKLFLC